MDLKSGSSTWRQQELIAPLHVGHFPIAALKIQLDASQASKNRRERLLVLAVLGLVSSLMVLALIAWFLKRLEEKNRLTAQLASLSQQLLTYSQLNQQLAGLLADFAALAGCSGLAVAGKMEDDNWDWLISKGLLTFLRSYGQEFGRRHGLQVELHHSGQEPRLPAKAYQQVVRIVQEALHNVAKHARASRVDISLGCAEQRWWLMLADNGQGFDLEQTGANSYGLSIMAERAAEAGLEFTIESEPGQGTVIRLAGRWEHE
ncbi:sensor histidine kinase [Carboxydocella sp. JDF658]|uniref:sensor histidine kinase n=1 Tax=Carboxydocella sp. JDF658 TaxID=1926600 RepID=UPI0035DD41E8